MTTREEATAHGDNVVHVEHTFEAPREMVFKAWTDPQLMSQWYAPEPLTIPRAELDVRPGGHYSITMRDQDGNDFTSVGEYRDVVEPERIVFTDSVAEMPSAFVDMVNDARGQAHGTPVPDGLVTLTFTAMGGQTQLTFHEEFDSKATRDAWVEMQMVEGLEGSFENLEKVLSRSPSMSR